MSERSASTVETKEKWNDLSWSCMFSFVLAHDTFMGGAHMMPPPVFKERTSEAGASALVASRWTALALERSAVAPGSS
jgi:hypothetical protein